MKYIILLILLMQVPLATAMSLGVSPSRIIKDNTLSGSEFEEELILSKSSRHPIPLQITLEGNASSFIAHPDTIIFSENKSTMRVPFTVRIPENTVLGDYTATIQYLVVGESNVHMAFSIPVSITVTDEEDAAYQVKHVNPKQKGSQTIISFEVHNKGNIESGPDTIEIKIINNADNAVVYEEKKSIQMIKPFSKEKKEIIFDTQIGRGNYWVQVGLSGENLNGEINSYQEKVFLEVESKKNLITANAVKEVQQENSKDPDQARLYSIVTIIIVFVAFIAAPLLLAKKRK